MCGLSEVVSGAEWNFCGFLLVEVAVKEDSASAHDMNVSRETFLASIVPVAVAFSLWQLPLNRHCEATTLLVSVSVHSS